MRDLLIAIEELHKLAKHPDKVIYCWINKAYDLEVKSPGHMLHIEVRYTASKDVLNEKIRDKLFNILTDRIGVVNTFKMTSRGIPIVAIPLTEIESAQFNGVTDMSLDFNSVRLLPSVSLVFKNHVEVMITEKGLYITSPEDIENVQHDMIHAKTGKCCLRQNTIPNFWECK